MLALERSEFKFREAFLSGGVNSALTIQEASDALGKQIGIDDTVFFVGEWGKGRELPCFFLTKYNDMGTPMPKVFRSIKGVGSGIPSVRVFVDGRLVASGRVAFHVERGCTQEFRLPRGKAVGKKIRVELSGEFSLLGLDIEWDLIATSIKEG